MSNGRDAKPGGFCCAARTHLVTSDLICPLELAGRWVAELAVHGALEDLEVLVEPTAALEERGAHGRDVDSATRTRDSFTTHQHAQTKLKPSVKVEHLAHVTA